MSVGESEDHREFLLAALRGAALRARLLEADVNAVGVALKSDLIDCETALRWLREAGALPLVGPLPLNLEGDGDA